MGHRGQVNSWGVSILALLWLLGIAAGSWGLESYKASAGGTGTIPLHARNFEHPAAVHGNDSPRLVMFLHPHCPCSRASLAELAEILTRSPAITAEIVLVKPDITPDGWEDTDIRRAAAQFPRTSLTVDDGSLAHKLGAKTSGHVVLFDASGAACFSGGITRSRGHLGESCGRRSILALLQGDHPEANTSPVFGCPLLAADSCPLRGTCCKTANHRAQP